MANMDIQVLYHHRTQGHGAEGVHIKGVVDGLTENGCEVTIVSPPGIDPLTTAGYFSGKKEKPGFKARFMGLVSQHAPQWLFELAELAYNIYGFKKLNTKAAEIKPKFLYERYALFLFSGVWLKKRHNIPLILEVNDCTGLKRSRKQTLTRLASAIELRIFHNADAIIVVSSFLKEELIKRGIEPDKVHIFPNSVDVNKFDPDISGDGFRQKYNTKDKVTFGFVGWFDPWDRLDFLIDAFSKVHDSYADTKLLLVGDGPGKQNLETHARKLGLSEAVILTGAIPRNEMQSLIASLDICVIPHSNVFGSPIVMFEYMAMAKAIIAPQLPPIMDVVTHDTDGFIFEPGDLNALVNAMCSLLNDKNKRQSFGEEAKKKIYRDHLWSVCGEKVLNLVDEINIRKVK